MMFVFVVGLLCRLQNIPANSKNEIAFWPMLTLFTGGAIFCFFGEVKQFVGGGS